MTLFMYITEMIDGIVEESVDEEHKGKMKKKRTPKKGKSKDDPDKEAEFCILERGMKDCRCRSCAMWFCFELLW